MQTSPASETPILVPFDGSRPAEAALPYAASFAAGGTPLLLLKVLPPPEAIHDLLGAELLSADTRLSLGRADAEADLARAADRLRTAIPGSIVETAIEVGDAAETIARVADDRQTDLIVLASCGHSAAAGRPAFGSVAHRVVRTAHVPVLIVHPPARDEPAPGGMPVRRLLLPLDGSELGDRAVAVAQRIGARLELPLHLLSVVDADETLVPALDYGSVIGRQHLQELMADAHGNANRVVEGHGARLLSAGLTASWEVRRGPAAATILDALSTGDLLVISSHGHSSFRRWHIGSVAEKLLLAGNHPVLVVRPPRSAVAAVEDGSNPNAPIGVGNEAAAPSPQRPAEPGPWLP